MFSYLVLSNEVHGHSSLSMVFCFMGCHLKRSLVLFCLWYSGQFGVLPPFWSDIIYFSLQYKFLDSIMSPCLCLKRDESYFCMEILFFSRSEKLKAPMYETNFCLCFGDYSITLDDSELAQCNFSERNFF